MSDDEERPEERGETRSGFATRAIHVGQEPDAATGAVIPPIHATSTFVMPRFGEPGDYIYSRTSNPTRTALEASLASLEGGDHGIAFASGLAAIDAVLRLLDSGDHVICTESVYGGTYQLFEEILRRFGLEFSYIDTDDLDDVAELWRDSTRMLYVETPTNPTMRLTDVRGAAELAGARDALLVVDNTFMSPYLQQPLDHGADVVVHSTTKYLNGHSDSIGGVAVTSRDEIAERLRFVAKRAGAVLSPFEAWLIQRGVKTLALRMERHDANGRAVAAFLEEHPRVGTVHYPGLATHPQHDLARRQMSGYGGMISFELDGIDAVRTFLDALEICTLAESLGGVETLISHPASMTHVSMPAEERRARGITDGLVRLSVGVEEVEDLVEDLRQALEA